MTSTPRRYPHLAPYQLLTISPPLRANAILPNSNPTMTTSTTRQATADALDHASDFSVACSPHPHPPAHHPLLQPLSSSTTLPPMPPLPPPMLSPVRTYDAAGREADVVGLCGRVLREWQAEFAEETAISDQEPSSSSLSSEIVSGDEEEWTEAQETADLSLESINDATNLGVEEADVAVIMDEDELDISKELETMEIEGRLLWTGSPKKKVRFAEGF
ncbi:hypothetical protein EDC01DRAFT_635089 [Geopyxis carbonaria]|nr:hypothetical protein EDC01DRAFT_635089 [Geopyxis carbonaria]